MVALPFTAGLAPWRSAASIYEFSANPGLSTVAKLVLRGGEGVPRGVGNAKGAILDILREEEPPASVFGVEIGGVEQ